MRPRLLIVGLAIGLGIAESSAQTPLQMAMREKLTQSQRLLADVITADYEGIYKNASPLARISETEIASWQARSNPDYIRNAVLFLDSVKGMRDAAVARDIEAARLEYVNLISSCVRCHTYVRGARIASGDSVPVPALGQPGERP
jgi:hypothetical protein